MNLTESNTDYAHIPQSWELTTSNQLPPFPFEKPPGAHLNPLPQSLAMPYAICQALPNVLLVPPPPIIEEAALVRSCALQNIYIIL